ncbi:MAG: N-acetylmuramoyl-L-alanine amidase [Desulfuromonadales bacterium]|nr:N-acetylmuramoyl-L-alanine amidase [Desulfuromonadales bacterium]
MTKTIRQFTLLLLLLTLAAPALAKSAEQAYQEARDAYYVLQNSARKQMYRDQWLKVIDLFQSVQSRHADHKRGADALFMVAKTRDGLYVVSRVEDDARQAADDYRQMARRYPASSLADDALFRAGELAETVLDEPQQAWTDYSRLLEIQPAGDMAPRARAAEQRLSAWRPLAKSAEPPSVSPPVEPAPPPSQASLPSGEKQLTAIRFWSNPGYTRIVLDLSAQSEFSAHFLAADSQQQSPPRLYIDLPSCGLSDGLKEPTIVDDGLLRRIRTGKPDARTVRVVLDLKSIGDYKVFQLPDPYRVVIDIAGEQVAELTRRETEIRTLPPADGDAIAKILDGQPGGEPTPHVPVASASTSLRRIVIDPGHGGKDPGAVGPGGTYEKNITLAMARRLAEKLRKELGCEVILTRNGDVYLPLEERTAIANKVGADLFISIHANANNSRKAYGVETYYLNFAKNDKAAAVVARENGTSLKQVGDLELILFDLMANSKINESSRLAAEIQKSLVDRLSRNYDQVRDMGVRQGPFYVLLGATMPSVLVETAFISNPREEKRLKSGAFQDHATDAIAKAVKKYAVDNRLVAAAR